MTTSKNNGLVGEGLSQNPKTSLSQQGRAAAHHPNDTLAVGRVCRASSQTSRELLGDSCAPGEEVNSVTVSSKEQGCSFKNH